MSPLATQFARCRRGHFSRITDAPHVLNLVGPGPTVDSGRDALWVVGSGSGIARNWAGSWGRFPGDYSFHEHFYECHWVR